MTPTKRPLGGPEESGAPIKATFARYGDRPDECTLHPVDPDEGKQRTEWITAKDGSYVSAAMWR